MNYICNFKVGDKVFCVKNSIFYQSGIGTVVRTNDDNLFPIYVLWNDTDETQMHADDELLLTVDPNDVMKELI